MIETERLELIPLIPKLLQLWVENILALEKELNCFYKAELLEGIFLNIVKNNSK